MNGDEYTYEVDKTPVWLKAKIDQALAALTENKREELRISAVFNMGIVCNIDDLVMTGPESHGHPCTQCGTLMACDEVYYEADYPAEHSSGVIVLFMLHFCKKCGDGLVDKS